MTRALAAIRHLVTNAIDVPNGHAQYTAMCHPNGGIVDDLICAGLADDEILVTVNAAAAPKTLSGSAKTIPKAPSPLSMNRMTGRRLPFKVGTPKPC